MCSDVVFLSVNTRVFSIHSASAKKPKQTKPKLKACLYVLSTPWTMILSPEIFRLFWMRFLYVEMPSLGCLSHLEKV